jgi:hypothetical protein
MYGRACGRCGGVMGVVSYEQVARLKRRGDRAVWRCEQCKLELDDATGDMSPRFFLLLGVFLAGYTTWQGGLGVVYRIRNVPDPAPIWESIGALAVGVALFVIVGLGIAKAFVNWRWMRRSPLNELAPAKARPTQS